MVNTVDSSARIQLSAEEQTPVPAANIMLNYAGFAWNEWSVILPAELGLDDLKNQHVWRRSQSSPATSFRVGDIVRIRDHAASWIATCTCTEASVVAATMSKPSVVQLVQRTEMVVETDLYKLEWQGSGWGIRRKKDNHLMPNIYPNREGAIRALDAMAPKQAGAPGR